MKSIFSRLHTSAAVLAVAGLLSVGLLGCGGSSSDSESASGQSETLNMVTVNWIEGMALTYMQERLLEDSLGMTVEVNEVQGGGIAFSSVAGDGADFFNEAWLPTTHQKSWGRLKGDLQKLGYTYRGTSAGLVVPSYMDLQEASEIGQYREQLDGKIYGIEAGSPTNENVRQILANNNIDGFEVVAASGPATWQALQSAIDNQEPIVVTGWKPHWKWGSFDLKYIQGAQTGQSPVFGAPEDIFTIVDNEFIDEFPKETVCFLQRMEVNDRQIESLMDAFKNRGDMSKSEAMQQWVQNHPQDVSQWLDQARECAASDQPVEPLPDDATYSRDQQTESA
jgi:glycine betaine/proline transport system substrate-binding protein